MARYCIPLRVDRICNRMLRELAFPAVSQELLISYVGNGISWLVKRALTGDMHAEPDSELYAKALPILKSITQRC